VISNRLSFRDPCQTSHIVSLAYRTSSYCVAVGMLSPRAALGYNRVRAPWDGMLHEINMNHHQRASGALCTVSEPGYDAARTM
jgi:hypothetical protein